MNIFYPWFKLDGLNGFVVFAIGLFYILTSVYSSKFMKNIIRGKGQLIRYYAYILLTAIISIATVLSNNLILLLIFWGFLGLVLYLLINMGDNQETAAVAKKAFIIIGGSDALMLLGIGIIYYLSGSFQMDKIKIPLAAINPQLSTVAYLCLAVACFAKAGAMPLHSWIPDCAKSAPVPVVAYILASLDKLLGIYLLARISLNLFVMSEAMNVFLMLIGAFTIVAGVMMALIQHNMKRLLGYHAVSQVGYMVLGIGTGNPLGIAGGLFHMLNNAVYKSCLFLSAGNVELKTNTADLDKLGGLSAKMPLTYLSTLIASFSISGVPPFNGFFSKWMIYQGLISRLTVNSTQLTVTKFIIIFCLAAAMFGSGLTLASFMKLIHATFFGPRGNTIREERRNEVSWQMWFPPILLAAICIVFGIFANQIPLKYFIIPAVGKLSFSGTWYAGSSTLLIIIGLILGLIIVNLKWLRPSLRIDKPFVGGELTDSEENLITGTEFYNTVKEFGILRNIYRKAEVGLFDLYEQGKNLVFGIGKFLQYLHNGVLPTYLVWVLLGMIGLFIVLLK